MLIRHLYAIAVAQLEENIASLDRLGFSDDELAEIDRTVTEAGIDLWPASRAAG